MIAIMICDYDDYDYTIMITITTISEPHCIFCILHV